MHYRFVLSFILLLFGAVCASAAAPPSSINVNVEATATDIAAIVNQALPKDLYKGEGGLGTSLSVVRTGPVAVSMADNYLYLTLPVQLTFKYALYESAPLRAGLRFKAKVNVTPDWRLQTELYYLGLSEALADSFQLGPISLKPKSAMEKISQPVQRLLAPLIDAKVNDAVQLKTKVGRVWQNAFTPTLVSKEFGAWLRLAPERIVMTPLLAANNRLQLCVGVITGAEITVGPRPAPAPVKALPPVQQLAGFDRSFRIQLGTDVFFADLVNALKPVLLEKTFGEEKKITVKRFDLKGEEGRLVVALTTVGDFEGELTVVAKPVYNSQSNTLSFEEVDFDTKNAGFLMSAGSWLFSSTIRNTIKTKLDSSMVEQLEKARVKASTALAAVQIGEHVKLTGAVKSLHLGEPVVRNDRLSLQVVAQGESSVYLK